MSPPQEMPREKNICSAACLLLLFPHCRYYHHHHYHLPYCETLRVGVDPVHLVREEVDDTVHGTIQREATDEKGDQHNVGEGGGEVNNLGVWATVLVY